MSSLKCKGKKSKSKLIEITSETDSDSEHELFHYSNDRVQLMKEVLKLIKPKKIKAMAPDCLKKHDSEEINSILLEELLGISNKRLKKIFDGQNVDDASSSSDEDANEKPLSIISLDDISDSEDDLLLTGGHTSNSKHKSKKHKSHKIKSEPKEIKQESKSKSRATIPPSLAGENDKVLSVLELLELQARARAIRSQLVLEAENKAKEAEAVINEKSDSDDDAVAVIDIDPISNEIIISSGESESEVKKKKSVNGSIGKKKQKVKINRTRYANETTSTLVANTVIDGSINIINELCNNENLEIIESAPINSIDSNIVVTLENNKCISDNLENIPLPDTNNCIDESIDENLPEIEAPIECKPKKINIIDDQIISASKSENNENKKDLIPVVAQKESQNNCENDNVINLDIVEIDGIDD